MPESRVDVAVVGGGIAGLACATDLAHAGASVLVLDKGRGPGGRMATRRLETPAGPIAFDHGAQYFTAREPSFVNEVARWQAAGLAAAWPAAGPDAWVGTPKMSAIVASMAQSQSVRWATQVTHIERSGGGFRVDGATSAERIVVATPAEQAAVLIGPLAPSLASAARATPSRPCWTLMVAFAETIQGLDDVVRHRGAVVWAARNSAKPMREPIEAWVVQASAEWSQQHLEDDDAQVADALLAAFAVMVGAALPRVVAVKAHRWRYAKSGATRLAANYIDGVGVAGDWLRGPRVEDAWLSGRRLAAEMVAARVGGP